MEQFMQAAMLHGPALVYKARQEWQDVAGSSLSFLTQTTHGQKENYFWQRLEENKGDDPDIKYLSLFGTKLDKDFKDRIHSFISSKSDLLFSGKTAKEGLRKGIDYNTIPQDCYGEVAPLEGFMGIPTPVKTCQLLKVIQEGDIVIGKITAIKPFGLFIQLLDLEFSRRRDFFDSNIQAICRPNDLNQDKKNREYSDPTEAFRVGDIIRGVILNVNSEDSKIAVSLKPSHLSAEHQDLPLGLLEDFDENKLRYDVDEDKSYMKCLTNHPGRNNPRSIETLMDKLGIDAHSSLMRGLQRNDFPKEDYFDEIRKKQSIKWSMATTAKGVEHFKAGETSLALKYLDHALQIDSRNIEALVAKGALSANSGKYSTAIQLFRQSLSINNKHRNAMKYLVDTLVEQGIQQEKTSHLNDAEKSFQEVLVLQPDHMTAKDHMTRVKTAIKCQKEQEVARDKKESDQSTFSHVRRLIEEEEQHRRKKKKKKDKKKKKKREKKKSSRKSKHNSYSTSETSESDSDSPTPSKRRRSHDDDDEYRRRKSTSRISK